MSKNDLSDWPNEIDDRPDESDWPNAIDDWPDMSEVGRDIGLQIPSME